MGIHYDYKSKRGERAVLKQAKREARLAAKKAKRKNITAEASSSESIMHDIQKPTTLEDLIIISLYIYFYYLFLEFFGCI